MPVEGTREGKRGQDGQSAYLTNKDMVVEYGFVPDALKALRENPDPCPFVKVGGEFHYPREAFAMWLEHRSLEGVRAIGCRKVVQDKSGKVVAIIDLKRRYFKQVT